MQIVIDISEKQYEIIKELVKNQNSVCPDADSAEKIILKGTPLPKGHGRLFDERDIVDGSYEIIGNRIYELEPIIEADKSGKESER